MMEEMVRAWFGAWGQEKGFSYAERFRRLQMFEDPSERLRRFKKSLRGSTRK
jgi:hypothetical protein